MQQSLHDGCSEKRPLSGFTFVRNLFQPFADSADTVGSEMSKPSSSSSPWIRGAPQFGFSLFMRLIADRRNTLHPSTGRTHAERRRLGSHGNLAAERHAIRRKCSRARTHCRDLELQGHLGLARVCARWCSKETAGRSHGVRYFARWRTHIFRDQKARRLRERNLVDEY